MSGPTASPVLYVGWDVGGWNCDRNRNSRDALVALDEELRIVGRSWRGNLRRGINESVTAEEFVNQLLELCGAESITRPSDVYLAIDCPLGFSQEFVQLVTKGVIAEPVGGSATNSYLFRQTERFLFTHQLTPLSAVKDMIGSQATKGIHVLAKFAPSAESCGVWHSKGDHLLTAFEAYPSACKASRLLAQLRKAVTGECSNGDDEQQALTCALIAFLFANKRHELEPPDGSVPMEEGWIWLPKDALEGAPQ